MPWGQICDVHTCSHSRKLSKTNCCCRRFLPSLEKWTRSARCRRNSGVAEADIKLIDAGFSRRERDSGIYIRSRRFERSQNQNLSRERILPPLSPKKSGVQYIKSQQKNVYLHPPQTTHLAVDAVYKACVETNHNVDAEHDVPQEIDRCPSSTAAVAVAKHTRVSPTRSEGKAKVAWRKHGPDMYAPLVCGQMR